MNNFRVILLERGAKKLCNSWTERVKSQYIKTMHVNRLYRKENIGICQPSAISLLGIPRGNNLDTQRYILLKDVLTHLKCLS